MGNTLEILSAYRLAFKNSRIWATQLSHQNGILKLETKHSWNSWKEVQVKNCFQSQLWREFCSLSHECPKLMTRRQGLHVEVGWSKPIVG